EGFEGGAVELSSYQATGSSTVSSIARVLAAAKHDGNYGLDMASSTSWVFRTGAAVQVQQGETLTVWVQMPTFATGKAYFGFGASASGTLSMVLTASFGSGLLSLDNNSNYGDILRASSAQMQAYQPGQWYLLTVVWGIGGSITGRLYASDGTTLLKS